MEKLSNFLKKSVNKIQQRTTNSISDFIKRIQNQDEKSQHDKTQRVQSDVIEERATTQKEEDTLLLTVDKISFSKPLQGLDLEESKVILTDSLRKIKSSSNQANVKMSNSRIKQIEQQKKRILDQLKKLDGQIADIKKEKEGIQPLDRSMFRKKIQISDDLQAKKQAQSLIKQLHLQKIKMQEKKRKLQERQLEQRKRQEQSLKKERQQTEKRLKQEKRQIIERRMQQQRRKRLERKIVDKQSNLLISELKKQEQFQKQRQQIPSQIMQYEQKKKLLEKKNIFNISQIQSHEKKYKQFKSKQKQLRRERSESIKVTHQIPKYGKNMWVEKIQEEQIKRKQQQKIKELNKKLQLQKRMQYGNIVKNIFMSKNKKRQESVQKISHQQSFNEQIIEKQVKPKTPDQKSHLPQIPRSDQKRQNQTDKKFKERQQSNSTIQNKRSRVVSKAADQAKQKDPEEIQKLMKQKQREQQLRKQTKQRLKKLENKSIDLPKPEKVKYENYIAKVKVKKSDPHEEWKRIMSNERLSKQQKYKEMLNKAVYLQNQAKIKEDLRKSGDQDAVNLYIGSIQAKLALLQKF